MKEITINISKDFNKYLGGREKRVAQFSGEDFREKFLEENVKTCDRINVELDGVLGYPIDFLDETFGKMARRLGKKKFKALFNFISAHTYTTQKIDYMVDHAKKE